MIDVRTLQEWLQTKGLYTGPLDGIWGSGSTLSGMNAIGLLHVHARDWPPPRVQIGTAQAMLHELGLDPGNVDGFDGPNTEAALARWQDMDRDIHPSEAAVAHQPTVFPREQAAEAFYGAPGTNHTLITLPYPMRVSWDPSKTISTMTINERCGPSAVAALRMAHARYGYQRLRDLGLDLFGGCYANRAKRNGTVRSMHAFAAAIDFDPDHNHSGRIIGRRAWRGRITRNSSIASHLKAGFRWAGNAITIGCMCRQHVFNLTIGVFT